MQYNIENSFSKLRKMPTAKVEVKKEETKPQEKTEPKKEEEPKK